MYIVFCSCDFDEVERGAIALGLNDIEVVSCAKFRPATTADKDWVVIDHQESGCSATLGYYGPGHGAHSINLERAAAGSTSTCVAKSVVIHEALHIMGVQHEQSRPDRDEYITINWHKMEVSRKWYQSIKYTNICKFYLDRTGI